jgi:hypothetical protein
MGVVVVVVVSVVVVVCMWVGRWVCRAVVVVVAVEPVHQLVGKVEAVLLPFRFVQNLTIPHEHEAAVAQVRGMDVPLHEMTFNTGSIPVSDFNNTSLILEYRYHALL